MVIYSVFVKAFLCTLEPRITACMYEYIIIGVFFFGFFFFAVSLIFNGTTITGPILIYHDEIGSGTTIPTDENSNGPGDLVCRTASIARPFWRHPNGATVPTSTSGDIYQVRTDQRTHPSLARLSTLYFLDSTDSAINGLWICPLGFTGDIDDQDVIASFIYVVCDTTGGPPEISTWTRNGVTISDGGSYSISLTVPGVTSTSTNDLVAINQIFQQSRYRSTLTVTGNLPGVYVYTVINRAMSAPRTASFTIEGMETSPAWSHAYDANSLSDYLCV